MALIIISLYLLSVAVSVAYNVHWCSGHTRVLRAVRGFVIGTVVAIGLILLAFLLVICSTWV